ncbi:anthranilate phosphoribosyltransferase [Rubritalea squalenifaciens DSM 18772]|uniref:Anthranilate phosphoribosyltransferase n=1 Tax=Rubritalea squalenifaciens DSM 18772 TaxID=1123071 RepID=A0A1M6M4T5_9BACT|nr:anthranilate phosphoribosyltransferase [Rubritalea squalenifaciens]SHJ78380.1 anthranilate phosphoribosyltransferase [Rubritalea squalenifaciens DSM 18772]
MDAVITHVENGEELSAQEINVVAEFLLDETASSEKKARFLKAFSLKGETAAEISGLVECFLDRALDPGVAGMELDGPTIDVCGTGGDKLDLFNVSTTSMFVIAAGGATVVKHGNRGITSKSGGADVLEALGIKLDIPPAQFRDCLSKAGLGFLFAPMYHPAFKAVGPVRQELAKEGVRTVFNLIGPLLNPARPQCQLVGVFDESMNSIFADILGRLGRDSAWVVNGKTADGLAVDEMSLMGPTRICKSGNFQDSVDEVVTPEDLGLSLAKVEDLQGGDATVNAKILEEILMAKDKGPKRDMVVLNSAAGLACAGLADDLLKGIDLARELIDSGEALNRLRLLQDAAS